MASKESGERLFAEVGRIVTESQLPRREQIAALRRLLERLCDGVLAGETQYFPDLFNRCVFILDRYRAPRDIADAMHGLRILGNKAVHESGFSATDGEYAAAVSAICKLITYFTQVPIPTQLERIYAGKPGAAFSRPQPAQPRDNVGFVRMLVRETKAAIRPNQSGGTQTVHTIMGSSEDLGDIAVTLWDKFSEVGELAWKYATLHLYNIQKVPDREGLYSTTNSSIVVLEPDYLVNATAIASTYGHKSKGLGVVPYLVDKFIASETTEPMLVGTLANTCLDELIANLDFSLDDALPAVFRENSRALLQLLALGITPEALRQRLRPHFEVLRRVVADFHRKQAEATVEPSFLSDRYGIQGRLDALLDYSGDAQLMDIIELKSGTAPHLSASNGGAGSVWPDNFAQTVCYNLMLEQPFPKRRGSTSILYSQDSMQPLRAAAEVIRDRQDALLARNRIVALEHALQTGHTEALTRLTPDEYPGAPKFIAMDIAEVSSAVGQATDLERAYFLSCVTFVARELWLAKIGAHPDRGIQGFAALWRADVEDKRKRFDIVTGLKLTQRPDTSDPGIVRLDRRSGQSQYGNFRKDDIAVLYPVEPDGSTRPTHHRILKCTILEITPQRIVIRLRNRQISPRYFARFVEYEWALEHDLLETNYDYLYQSLLLFLHASRASRELLLGLSQPRFGTPPTLAQSDLTKHQQAMVTRALSAQDYFLLQGPPGTGKTSRIVRELVRALHADPHETILLLAYTNRAVDEICDTLVHLKPEVEFIRLGHTSNTAHSERTLSHIAATCPVAEAAERIGRTRIIVSTVLSYLGHPDIMRLKEFTTAIVDEASQLLEPHLIGSLSHVGRFILIGDHNQLPAVVAQAPEETAIRSDQLRQAGITNLRMSLFERLWLRCGHQHWEDARGQLVEQGRMHPEIQTFPSHRFYGGKLRHLSESIPTGPDWLPAHLDRDLRSASELLALSRLIFIPTSPVRNPADTRSNDRTDHQEAMRVVGLVALTAAVYADHFNAQTVGVITPWRAQVAEIRTLLQARSAEVSSEVLVDTVERFQGSERDVIIISFATSQRSMLGHLVDLRERELVISGGPSTGDSMELPDSDVRTVDRKLNVALTRARSQIIVLGRHDVLGYAEGGHFQALFGHISDNGYVMTKQDCQVLDRALESATLANALIRASGTSATR